MHVATPDFDELEWLSEFDDGWEAEVPQHVQRHRAHAANLNRAIAALSGHDQLRSAGISTVLHRHPRGRAARISFLINARHNFEQIDRAGDAVGEIIARSGSTTKEGDHVEYLDV